MIWLGDKSEVTTTTTHLLNLCTNQYMAREWIRSNYDDYTFVKLMYISVYGQGMDQK